jgi:hypothetical protein
MPLLEVVVVVLNGLHNTQEEVPLHAEAPAEGPRAVYGDVVEVVARQACTGLESSTLNVRPALTRGHRDRRHQVAAEERDHGRDNFNRLVVVELEETPQRRTVVLRAVVDIMGGLFCTLAHSQLLYAGTRVFQRAYRMQQELVRVRLLVRSGGVRHNDRGGGLLLVCPVLE